MGLYLYNLPKRKKDKAKAHLHPGMKLQQASSQAVLGPAGEVPAPGLQVLRQAPCVVLVVEALQLQGSLTFIDQLRPPKPP